MQSRETRTAFDIDPNEYAFANDFKKLKPKPVYDLISEEPIVLEDNDFINSIKHTFNGSNDISDILKNILIEYLTREKVLD